MIIVDVHTHTAYGHGKNTVREMFDAGQAHGLKIHGFSEHSPRPAGYDYPVEYREHLEAHFSDYLKEVQEIQAEAKNTDVTVLLGMELDWFEAEPAAMKKISEAFPLDYIIAGIHFLGHWGFDASADDWSNKSDEECAALYTSYYRTMKKMAQSGIFQVVAHPDLIKIFSADRFHRWLPDHLDLVREALTAARDAGMAMEISSAGLHKMCAEIYPCPEIMRIAADINIPISFASDGHCVNSIARDFDKLASYAHSYGFSESVWFQQKTMHTQPF